MEGAMQAGDRAAAEILAQLDVAVAPLS
jgi:hypothetical protein